MPRIQVTTNSETGDSFPVEICCNCAKQYPPNPQNCGYLLMDIADVAFRGRRQRGGQNGYQQFCCAKSMAKAMQTIEEYPGPVYEDAVELDNAALRCILCNDEMGKGDYDWPKFK